MAVHAETRRSTNGAEWSEKPIVQMTWCRRCLPACSVVADTSCTSPRRGFRRACQSRRRASPTTSKVGSWAEHAEHRQARNRVLRSRQPPGRQGRFSFFVGFLRFFGEKGVRKIAQLSRCRLGEHKIVVVIVPCFLVYRQQISRVHLVS